MASLEVVGAVLIGGVFIWAGIEHFAKFDTTTRLLTHRVPAPALVLSIGSVVEIAAGICLAAGLARTQAALVLIAFTIAASVLLLDFWNRSSPEREALRSAFLINMAVVGGLLLAASGRP